MQNALDSQRNLYFEMENILGSISKIIKSSERPEEAIFSISSVIKSSRKLIKDAENSSRVAYCQLLSSRKISDSLEIDKSSFPDWKSGIKLSGQEIFDLEVSLSDLLASLISSNPSQCMGKLRECCTKLLKLGIQLPLSSSESHEDILGAEAKKTILLNIKPTLKSEVKEILNKLSIERKNINIEKDLMKRELESKVQDVNELDLAIKELRRGIEDKAVKIKSFFENKLMKPFEDVWNVYLNIEPSSAVQLFMVFKMHGDSIKEFVDNFPSFQF
jgi:hypothetical protein